MSKRREDPPPQEPGKLDRDDTAYVVPSDSDQWGPLVISARPPRRRDFWRVLRGRYVPRLKLSRTLTLKGSEVRIANVWDGATLPVEQLHQNSYLLDMIEQPPEGDQAIVPLRVEKPD